jgi:stage II sporulation protein D
VQPYTGRPIQNPIYGSAERGYYAPYASAGHENPYGLSNLNVNRTTGEVLVCDVPTGLDEIFPAYYGSACGGHTEDSRNVFGDSFGPLCGVACLYCRDVARPSIFYWPTAQFSKQDVTNKLIAKYPKLKALGEITQIETAKKSDYDEFSRITLVRLTGTNGKSDSMRGEDLRLTIDPSGARIRSISCRIMPMGDNWAFLSGRGYGHGVGLCQCGAEGMARAGKKTEEILSYYYPGSKPVRVY